jgi:hypothetical protein
MASMSYRHEIVMRVFLNAASNPRITADPVGYLKHVTENWPTEPVEAKSFHRRFESKAMLEAAYISSARGRKAEATHLLLRALRADPGRCSHRGTLSFLLEVVAGGGGILAFYRRAKSALVRHGGQERAAD